MNEFRDYKQHMVNTETDLAPEQEMSRGELFVYITELHDLFIQSQKATRYEEVPFSTEPLRSVVMERYRTLANSHITVDLYHRVTAVTAEHNTQPDGKHIIEASTFDSESMNGSDHEFGEGIYFGMNTPYLWKSGREEGSMCYVLHDIRIKDLFISGYSEAKMLGLLPQRRVTGYVEEDVLETERGKVYETNGFQMPERFQVFPSDETSDIKMKYVTLTPEQVADSSEALWWRHHGTMMGHTVTRDTLDEQSLAFLDAELGVIGTEMVDDPVWGTYQRVYVEETTPLLCMGAANLVSAKEIVFGVPGSPGRRLIDEFKKRSNIV